MWLIIGATIGRFGRKRDAFGLDLPPFGLQISRDGGAEAGIGDPMA